MNFLDQLMVAQHWAAEEGFHNFEAALKALAASDQGIEKEDDKRNSRHLGASEPDKDQRQKPSG